LVPKSMAVIRFNRFDDPLGTASDGWLFK